MMEGSTFYPSAAPELHTVEIESYCAAETAECCCPDPCERDHGSE